MITWNLLYAVLGTHLTAKERRRLAEAFETFCILEEDILDKENPSLDQRLLYVTNPAGFRRTADRFSEKDGLTFLIAEEDLTSETVPQDTALNFLAADLPLSSVCNRLLSGEHAFLRWNQNMERDLYREPDLTALLTDTAQFLYADLYYLDPGYRVLSSAQGAKAAGFDPPKTAEDPYRFSSSFLSQFSPEKWTAVSGWEGFFHAVYSDAQTAGHLLILFPAGTRTSFSDEICEQVSLYVSRYIHTCSHNLSAPGGQLSQLIGDLIEGRLSDPQKFRERAGLLHLRLQNYFRLIVITPDSPKKDIPPFLLESVTQIFPAAITVPYRETILVLNQSPRYHSRMACDQERFRSLLEKYQAVACIGNQTRWLTNLGAIYQQTRGCIPFALLFRDDPDCRIFVYEEYAMYQMIDLCARHCQEYFHGDLICLCYPGIISLTLYDEQHQTDYSKLLKFYLRNHCNASLTAKKFFMHRNTFQNKLARITRILGDDPHRPELGQRLLFSLSVIEYMKEYLKITDIYGSRRYLPPTAKLISR